MDNIRSMNIINLFVNLIRLMRFILPCSLFIAFPWQHTCDPPHSPLLQDLYGVRSDLGNLYKALGRLEEAKVCVCARMCVSVEMKDLLLVTLE